MTTDRCVCSHLWTDHTTWCDSSGCPCRFTTAPPLDGLTVERLARAVLIAAREYEWRRTDDGFEWYGSADEMAEGILAALRDEGEAT